MTFRHQSIRHKVKFVLTLQTPKAFDKSVVANQLVASLSGGEMTWAIPYDLYCRPYFPPEAMLAITIRVRGHYVTLIKKNWILSNELIKVDCTTVKDL